MFRIRQLLATPALVFAALPAASLAAQGGRGAAAPGAAAPAPPACDVDQMTPTPLAMASIARGKVVNAKSPDEGKKAVQDAFKSVFDKATSQNVQGRDYLTAQFMLLAIEYGGEMQKRGDLNMPGDKNQQVDLLVTADSLLTLTESAKPACHEEIAQWREYKPFANRIKKAYDAFAAKQFDAADSSARRAMIISKNAPQPYDVLWRIAQAKGDQDNEIKFLKLAVEKLGGDTANARVRANLMYNLGREQEAFAKAAQGDRKAAMWKGAAAAYLQVVTEHPASNEAPFAVSGIGGRWALTQDSTEAVQVVKVAREKQAQMGDIALAQAAVLAVRLKSDVDAGELFKAATAANPYSRDYLYNYAVTLLQLKKPAEIVPAVQKLVAIDPSNPDNLILFAYAYKGMADETKDAALKKAYTDSAVAYTGKSDNMKVKVSYTAFDRGDKTTSLQGEIENRDKAAKSYTIEFEFVDKTGATVEKKSVTVGPVDPNKPSTFTVEIDKGGVAGVKYPAIP